MLTCTPQSFFSSAYDVTGCPGGASINFYWLADAGTIEFGGHVYQIKKQGWFSGRWALERSGDILYTAQKPGFSGRAFVIAGGGVTFEMRRGFMMRNYSLIVGNEFAGSITPGFWSRKTTVECNSTIPILAQLFAFWLCALMKRNESNAPAAP